MYSGVRRLWIQSLARTPKGCFMRLGPLFPPLLVLVLLTGCQRAGPTSTVAVIPFDLSSAAANACVLSNGSSVLPQYGVNAGSRCDPCTPNVSYPNAGPTPPLSGIA